jgi:hypothetical protein
MNIKREHAAASNIWCRCRYGRLDIQAGQRVPQARQAPESSSVRPAAWESVLLLSMAIMCRVQMEPTFMLFALEGGGAD